MSIRTATIPQNLGLSSVLILGALLFIMNSGVLSSAAAEGKRKGVGLKVFDRLHITPETEADEVGVWLERAFEKLQQALEEEVDSTRDSRGSGKKRVEGIRFSFRTLGNEYGGFLVPGGALTLHRNKRRKTYVLELRYGDQLHAKIGNEYHPVGSNTDYFIVHPNEGGGKRFVVLAPLMKEPRGEPFVAVFAYTALGYRQGRISRKETIPLAAQTYTDVDHVRRHAGRSVLVMDIDSTGQVRMVFNAMTGERYPWAEVNGYVQEYRPQLERIKKRPDDLFTYDLQP